MRYLIIALLIVLALPCFALAQTSAESPSKILQNTCNNGAAAGTAACKSVDDQLHSNNQNPIIGVIREAISIISYIIGIAAIIGLVVSGIRLMTANGDSGAVESARGAIVACLVGIAVAVLAQVIVVFVISG